MARQVTNLPVTEKTVANGNWDTSRATIDRIVIHTMVGTAAAADARFNNSTQQVSAHYGVLLDGSIWHWVDEDNTAYHAGNYAMNQRSIGIEHEDNGDYNGVRTDALYATSAKLVKEICNYYNIPLDRTHILKHSEVIATGCPDALDIDRIVSQAQGLNQPMATITQAELDQIRKARDDNHNQAVALQAQLDELGKKNQDLETGNSELQTQIADLSKQVGDLTKANEELKSQIATSSANSNGSTQTPPTQSNPTPDAPSQTTSGSINDSSVSSFFKALLAWLRGK